MPKEIHELESRLGPPWEAGGWPCFVRVWVGGSGEAGPMDGPGPDWVRLCPVSCFSCHLSDGFIIICFSFLLRHTVCFLPKKQDCLAISQKGNLRTGTLKAQSHEGSLERSQDYNDGLQRLFPFLCSQRQGVFVPDSVPDCACGYSRTFLVALFHMDTSVIGAGWVEKGRGRRAKREGRATRPPVHLREAETDMAHFPKSL